MKILLTILLLFTLLSCNSDYDKNIEKFKIKKIDTTRYSNKGYHDNIELLLFSNKEFKIINQVHFDLGFSKVTGTYSKQNNIVKLNPKLCLECKYVEIENIFKSICDTLKFDDLKFKIRTDYFSFNWKNKNYLLSDQLDYLGSKKNDFITFIDNYNNNYTPKYFRYLISDSYERINNKLPIDSFPKKYKRIIKAINL